jgi:hypothetical protein
VSDHLVAHAAVGLPALPSGPPTGAGPSGSTGGLLLALVVTILVVRYLRVILLLLALALGLAVLLGAADLGTIAARVAQALREVLAGR